MTVRGVDGVFGRKVKRDLHFSRINHLSQNIENDISYEKSFISKPKGKNDTQQKKQNKKQEKKSFNIIFYKPILTN